MTNNTLLKKHFKINRKLIFFNLPKKNKPFRLIVKLICKIKKSKLILLKISTVKF